MILADKIINERKKLGWSQEELADKLDVSRQSVSKWESAQSTPDLNRIIKLAEIFGVSTDYLLKDEIEEIVTSDIKESVQIARENVRLVSMEEATAFLDTEERTVPKVAFGVSLCILSPAVLLILAGLAAGQMVSEEMVALIGVPVLLVFVAIAVLIFIMCSKETDPFEYLEDAAIETAYGVDGMVKEKKATNDKKHTLFIALGVICCILCAVPLIVVAVISEKNGTEFIVPMMVAVLLALVATGVNLIIRGSSIMDAYNKLLEQDGFTPVNKKITKITKKVSCVYWPIILGCYLAWSLTTMKWEFTWIVWCVGAVLFAAIRGIIGLFVKE